MAKTKTSFTKDNRPSRTRKNAPNVVTGAVKEILTSIVENEFESGRPAKALKNLFDKNKIQYLQALDKLSECVVPKLSRTELTGENGEAIKILNVGVDIEKL